MDTFQNPLETVQLIPIFNYLNILSDFLFTEKFLPEIDQNKQIPVVNALYDYLQSHENNKFKQVELIRTLLKGSDLYGEKDDEYFDQTFVNAMFEYIISSLVFDKYGNIYGFLANIFRNANNLEIYEVINLIMIELESATFENEYGDSSVLSLLSLGRIYNDIILPLFPPPKTNLSLLSIDYIYAQAGSIFLRPGRINTAYYTDFETTISNLTDDDSFDEFLATGHAIQKLVSEKNNPGMLKAFALPALTYYIFNSKYLFAYENMANIIYHPIFWQKAYENLFKYTAKAFDDMEVELKNDNTLQIHFALSNFQSTNAMAKNFIEHNCTLPLKNPKTSECEVQNFLPTVKENFKHQINHISKVYQLHDLQIVQQAFPKSLVAKLETNNVSIKVLVPDSLEDCNFSENSSYDFLKFHFPDDLTSEYYLLQREDYKAILINAANNSEIFKKKNRTDFEKLFSASTVRILKHTNENVTIFLKNFAKYKASRLETCLKFLDEIGSKSLNWWKEFGIALAPFYPCLADTSGSTFGKSCKFNEIEFLKKHQIEPLKLTNRNSGSFLSLVPYYSCLLDTSVTNFRNSCALNEIKLLYKHRHDTSKLINANTDSCLSSIGTTIRSVFLRNVSYETVEETVIKEEEHKLSVTNMLNRSDLFEDICFHIKDPEFQLNSTTTEEINVLEKIINSLKDKTNLTFTSVMNSLSNMTVLKSHSFRSVGITGKNRSRLIFVNTLNNQSATGYGYKFVFLSTDSSRTAEFRTGYDLKDQRLLSLVRDSPKNEKKYLVLNDQIFQPQPGYYMYEINHQLRSKPTRVSFSGIPYQAEEFDEICDNNLNFDMWKILNMCLRRQRFIEKFNYEELAIRYIRKKIELSENEIRSTIERFTFPDSETLMDFANHWINNSCLNKTTWNSDYIIDYPNLLNELRYNFRFENHDVSEHEGTFRINSFYSQMERNRIEENASMETIIKDYNEQNATFSVTFHDYYAIRNFATTGYARITGDTREAKLMKIALYKLAIRQSDDPDEEFDLKLFRVENKPALMIIMTSFGKNIKLQKFTSCFPSVKSAIRFAGYSAPEFMNILYEMVFSVPYARAKLEQFYINKEKSVVLLPGSEFLITSSEMVEIGGLGRVLKLTLKFKHTDYRKYLWYKNIMTEIARIQF